MPLSLSTSNRMETLIRAFATMLGDQPLASPFDKELIVVQSRGMQRWISMRLAAQLGIWGGADYPFPNTLVQKLFEWFDISHAGSTNFSKEVMCWSVMRLLPGLLSHERFAPLHAYLSNDRDALKLFQLSGKIADTFDQYTLFRPDLLEMWEQGGDDGALDWQPELWRALVKESSDLHRGRMRAEFCRKVAAEALPHGFPTRISLFGVSYMPPYHIGVLEALASRIPVNIFLLSPTEEYWSDIQTRRRLLRMSGNERELSTEGNPLLASLGRSGREFSEMLLDVNGVVQTTELYADPGHDTLLHALQSDMLRLKGTGEDEERHALFERADRSVQVHSCHNPLREIEVLHDNLLDLFEALPGLEPRDIVVMTPDIETYAPYISTVFGTAGDGVPRLPHSIADRLLLDEGGIIAAVMKLLELYGSRHTAPALFDLLCSPPVSRRFRLDDGELDTIRRWVEETRIRWGVDEQSRSGFGLPPFRENSWRAGLERLLLGYAMPDEGTLYEGVLPFEVGADAETLGKLAEFIDAVETLSKKFEHPRRPEEWREPFIWMLDTFIEADPESERELSAVSSEVDRLTELGELSQFEGEVSTTVMTAWFRTRLEQVQMGLGFMTGGITFCAMLPMRSIPFRVVAMIGMNDGAFPRQQSPPGFDMMTREPRKGDRSVRGDDRYLFLESLLSARDVLYLSYVGQSIRDNSELPPSVLVSELLDAVDRGFSCSGNQSPSSRLVIRHKLQGFNPVCFSESEGLFSYSADNFRALEGRNSLPPRPFVEEPLPATADEERTVTIDDLVRFFANPSAFFLERRLGLKPTIALNPLEEREPFGAKGLEAYLIRQEMLEALLDGRDGASLLPLLRSRGVLPPATHGELIFRTLLKEVEEFAGRLLELKGGESGDRLDIDLESGGYRLTGRLENLLASGQLLYRCAKMREKDRIRSWICHLVLNSAGRGSPEESQLVMLDRSIRYRPAAEAPDHLAALLSLFHEGLSTPLPFFPRASLAWAGKADRTDRERLDAAMGAWRDGFAGMEGEGSEPAFRRCFGSEPPFGERFGMIADQMLLPMLEHGAKA